MEAEMFFQVYWTEQNFSLNNCCMVSVRCKRCSELREESEETTWEPTSANFKFSLKAVKIGTDHRKIVLGRHAQNADKWKWWAGRPRDHPWRDLTLSYVRRSQGSTTMFSVKTYISNIKTNLGNKTRFPKKSSSKKQNISLNHNCSTEFQRTGMQELTTWNSKLEGF